MRFLTAHIEPIIKCHALEGGSFISKWRFYFSQYWTEYNPHSQLGLVDFSPLHPLQRISWLLSLIYLMIFHIHKHVLRMLSCVTLDTDRGMRENNFFTMVWWTEVLIFAQHLLNTQTVLWSLHKLAQRIITALLEDTYHFPHWKKVRTDAKQLRKLSQRVCLTLDKAGFWNWVLAVAKTIAFSVASLCLMNTCPKSWLEAFLFPSIYFKSKAKAPSVSTLSKTWTWDDVIG